ncbi:hypothetical protein QC763_113465 [Podospora pseudopauciseta]|uniref:Uncharacterized protein n=1 Tax=Podospora pseudopauciseta TaxID=2093780 RepID=A0ABR0I0X1_9PEZI|nr:hypothetical protein QC763_113465 [Podospora pseudopauciseta]
MSRQILSRPTNLQPPPLWGDDALDFRFPSPSPPETSSGNSTNCHGICSPTVPSPASISKLEALEPQVGPHVAVPCPAPVSDAIPRTGHFWALLGIADEYQ